MDSGSSLTAGIEEQGTDRTAGCGRSWPLELCVSGQANPGLLYLWRKRSMAGARLCLAAHPAAAAGGRADRPARTSRHGAHGFAGTPSVMAVSAIVKGTRDRCALFLRAHAATRTRRLRFCLDAAPRFCAHRSASASASRRSYDGSSLGARHAAVAASYIAPRARATATDCAGVPSVECPVSGRAARYTSSVAPRLRLALSSVCLVVCIAPKPA